ncbi:MAG: RNA polymerase subunit sigma-70 [Firmicutes bacterium HGW-Firmicutes-16]|nr:MAG: RNA polymerase subunit sigma-70 [Firmicutes bacterium HGW-Firmicutes-16]
MTDAMTEALKKAKYGDKDASAQLIEDNSGLIWSIARRFFGRGVEADDLYQLGCVGFLKAIQGYDEEYGTQFSTYAVPKISGEIRRFLRDDGAVKVSRGIKERAQSIKSARSLLEQKNGREPSLSEISELTGLDAAEIASAETAVGPTESLQRETGEEGFTLEQVLGDFGEEERLVERVSLRETIARLPEREKSVISLRYFHSLTQDSTARVMGVSQVQVSRLEKRAVERLREMLE